MRRVVLLVTMTACGRLGFSEAAMEQTVDASPDPDAPPGALIATFGETPGAESGATTDTFLSSESMGVNFESSATVSVEGSEKRGLLRFVVGTIPTGSTVVSARLHLTLTAESIGAMIALSPVTESWVGTVATWVMRTASQSWTTAGAGSPGSAAAPIASFVAPKVGSVSVDLPTATVQSWVDTPSSNNGVVFSATGGGDVRLESSESATATARPELVVTYFP